VELAETKYAPLEHAVRRLRRRLWVERTVFATVILGMGACWLYPTLFPSVWAVYVDEKPVVAMRDRHGVEAVLQTVRSEGTNEAPGATFAQQVRIDRADPRRVEVADAETAAERLAGAVKLRAERAVVYVNGLPVVALPDEAQADAALEDVKASLAGSVAQPKSPPKFKEEVAVRVEPVEQELWADRETALALLRGEDGDTPSQHTVASGESAWSIARKYRQTMGALKQVNPGVNLARLKVGQKLSLGKAQEPLLTVITEGETTRVLPTAFPTEMRRSPKMYLGKRFVKQPGRPGKQRITYRVRLENGRVVSREMGQRSTVSPPRKQVVVVGTKPRTGG